MSAWLNLATKFLTTTKGQNAISIALATGGGAAFGLHICLHTAFLDKYRNIVQLYRNGVTSPITAEVNRRVGEVVEDMKLSEKYRGYLKVFYIQGFDPYRIGSFKTRSGAYVGVPGNFDYKTKDDIQRNKIMVGTEPVAWGTEDGQLLQHAVVLSENAQKFAIARELFHLDTHHVYFYGIIPTLSIIAQYYISAFANIKFYGHHKPKSFRYTVYSLVAIFTYGCYTTATDALTRYYENSADKQASSLGLNYAKGGVEFYTKNVQRNMAIRELMGSSGESLYTKFGNHNEILRQRHVPPLIRKENAERRVQEYLKATNANSQASNEPSNANVA